MKDYDKILQDLKQEILQATKTKVASILRGDESKAIELEIQWSEIEVLGVTIEDNNIIFFVDNIDEGTSEALNIKQANMFFADELVSIYEEIDAGQIIDKKEIAP